MSKCVKKSIKNVTFLSVIVFIVLAAAIVIGAIFGFNKSATVTDAKTLTVSMDSYVYQTKLDDVKDECDACLKGLDVNYVSYGEKTSGNDVSLGEGEIVYSFDKGTDISIAKAALEYRLAEISADGAAYDGFYFSVKSGTEEVTATLASGYVLRSVIAGLVFAVLALIYSWIRFRRLGIAGVVAISIVLGMGLTAGIIALTRIVVTEAVSYVIAGAGLLTAIGTMLTLGKIYSNCKSAEGDLTESFESGVACKEIATGSVALAVAVVFAAILAGTAMAWFATAALVAIAVSAFLGIYYVPALYWPVRKLEDKRIDAKAKYKYRGAEKSSKASEETPTEESVQD